MVVNCEQVWHEISNYLEDDVDASLRGAMDDHFRTCARCKSVLEGTRNVVQLYRDERLIEVPSGFSGRLERRLARESKIAMARLVSVAGSDRGPAVDCRWPAGREFLERATSDAVRTCAAGPQHSAGPASRSFCGCKRISRAGMRINPQQKPGAKPDGQRGNQGRIRSLCGMSPEVP